MLDYSGGIVLPKTSQAERNITRASPRHCVAHTILGDGAGVHIQAESHLELCNLFLLNAMKNVVELREQVRFHYGWNAKNYRQHIFDVTALLDCSSRIAFTVKPEKRLESGGFESEMQEVAWWMRELNFADELRIVSEADINQVDLKNAKILASVRGSHPKADAVALQVVSDLPPGGGQSLRDLTLLTGLAADGYRALIRLMRTGILRLQRHEVIGPKAVVIYAGATATAIHMQDRMSLIVRPIGAADGSAGQQTTA